MTDDELTAILKSAASAAAMHPIGRVWLASAEKLVAEVRRLQRGLKEALPYVTPSINDLVLEFNNFDGENDSIRDWNNEIRQLRVSLELLLHSHATPESPTIPPSPNATSG